LRHDTIELPIQINGKLRSRIEISMDSAEDDIKKAVLSDPIVNKWLEGKQPKKVIVVKGKLISLVT
jgi:leucyl-tRNA synthetase